MKQLLLLEDDRPLVERLGAEFFRRAPESPGVYLMRDQAGEALYIGKSKNLRNRLRNYRVANPDRMSRRHLRLLRSVAAIELHACESEASALAKEGTLLRNLRPRFNRAGTWPATTNYLTWRLTASGLELGVTKTVEAGWHSSGPLGAGAISLRIVLLRLLWCGIYPERGLAGLPPGWFDGHYGEVVVIPTRDSIANLLEEASSGMEDFFEGRDKFVQWLLEHVALEGHPFEVAVRAADLEYVKELSLRRNQGTS